MNEPQGAKPRRASGFLSLPSTGAGKWSARLLLVSLALILFNSFAAMPVSEQRTNLEPAQSVFNFAVFLCVVITGITGLFAIVMKRERSWILFISVLLLIAAAALNLGQLVNG